MKSVTLSMMFALSISLIIPTLTHEANAKSRKKSPYIQILSTQNYKLPVVNHKKDSYVIATYGHSFKIRVHNPTQTPIEAVVTVDGRDVINGKLGSFKNRGYIIPARDYLDIKGFRNSENSVAQFVFFSAEESYSSLVGTPQNVGVIGAAFFKQKSSREQVSMIARTGDIISATQDSSNPVVERSSDGAKDLETDHQKIGVGYGKTQVDHSNKKKFYRSSHKPSVVEIFYDSESSLIKRGIIKVPTIPDAPSAFPTENGYAPPPPATQQAY